MRSRVTNPFQPYCSDPDDRRVARCVRSSLRGVGSGHSQLHTEFEKMHRRKFIKTLLAGAATATVLPELTSHSELSGFVSAAKAAAGQGKQSLRIVSRSLDIRGRPAAVFGLIDGRGRTGLEFSENDNFQISLVNELSETTLVHWHGLKPPYEQDGVPDMPRPMLKLNEAREYDFPVGKPGTHWMHAHTLQEQNLLAAPLIVRSAQEASRDEQEVVILLHDFSFTPAEELLARLRRSTGHSMRGGGMGAMDLNDINYDAYLTNDRTLDDPEIVKVESGGRVRLRIINGATATMFWIDTGEVEAELIAVDGQDVVPLRGRRFPMAMGQRVDLRLRLPNDTKPYPILALREGGIERSGLILAPTGARVAKIAVASTTMAPAMGLDFEARLNAKSPLAERRADRTVPVMLTGGMGGYEWGIAGAERLQVRKGERVHVVMQNHSMMAHPMHLHGHHFQVVNINGKIMSGAVRDTVHVPPMTSVTIAFDADHPGKWAFHCHHLYHMASGMMAVLDYESMT